ncbi:MAG: polyamine aminopropyltransferase [Gammaproteobacteria bacterium]|nr:polyamine aminopropyltransferase [Gammaproteobacteria bacterium]
MAQNKHLLKHNIAIFSIMAVLAGCGLIYQYLLSHYAGRVLGAIETVIFAMIGIMIVAMGIGAFLARYIKCHFSGFAWLELAIALLGSTSVLFISGAFAFTHSLPAIIGETFGMPPDLFPRGGLIGDILKLVEYLPYVIGFILGMMIGAEIPLIARVRESLYGEHVKHNTGDIYGMDYIGAGVGAAIWIWLLITIEPTVAGALTAIANIGIGLLFCFLYYSRIKAKEVLIVGHILAGSIIYTVAIYGPSWDQAMEEILYQDKVVHHMNTKYQRIVLTERVMAPDKPPLLTFYINGRTQFSGNDEHIYHAMLTYPALAASARQDNILVIGGGDGLALRDILRWNPKEVTLIDLDPMIVDFFSTPYEKEGEIINEAILKLNDFSFSDPRVNLILGDAFIEVDTLLQQNKTFDTIIVDLPDPSHPDLNKLYSTRFYAKLLLLLTGDGAISIQSTSPYHAKNTFISIGKTVKHAGFAHVEQYHHNVPSFGEWGWTIATKIGLTPRQRLVRLKELPVNDHWLSRGKLLGSFEFGKNFFIGREKIKINRLGSGVIYQYHLNDWQTEQGISH